MLYDAVALLASAEGAQLVASQPAAKAFVTDAFAHCKFIGHVETAGPLLQAAGVADQVDDGFVALDADGSADSFVQRCADLRFWAREPSRAGSGEGSSRTARRVGLNETTAPASSSCDTLGRLPASNALCTLGAR